MLGHRHREAPRSSPGTLLHRKGQDGEAIPRCDQRRRHSVGAGLGPYTQPIAPEGTPSVLYIVLDDVGYSAMRPYGGLIETPNIDRIAQRGLTYTNFHTTALCSPTRSCLMTGRNHTTNGMATITEAASGFPSSNGHIPFECATIAEVLGESGWNTYMVGKWHLTAEDEMNMASRKAQWPVGRGFERFYGFLGAETNQWYPAWSTTTTRSTSPARRSRATT
jgi:arylsulfatase A-like enzyme